MNGVSGFVGIVCRGARAQVPRGLATLLIWAALTGASAAAAPTAELQKQVRAATFEVVLKKPEKDSVTYEKPLPLELIPFVQRNDHYWSVGTAFAIAPNTFVTAAHVIGAGVGSQFGTPAIRGSDEKVYTIDKILKYSNREDFAVFSVLNAPTVTPLPTETHVALDDPVFAVGNAMGEGVVIRDGLLTSLTPEAQDGRWKWLRFSAAASPGNSGGPLLDAQGHVIGVVAAKSPNENLNYALPIDLVLNGADKLAVFELRESFGVPSLLQGTIVGQFKDSFPLPQSFPEFSSRMRALFLRYFQEQQAKLSAAMADKLFPRGQSATLLAKLYTSFDPSLVTQDEDGSWDAHRCEGAAAELPGDARVWHCKNGGPGLMLFRLQYPGTGVDERHYHDSKEFLDLLLKGVNLPRLVGTQPVRITSLGPALQETVVHDHYGRVWQMRTWSLGYADLYFMTMALPTPDGYAGMATYVPSGLGDIEAEQLKFVADYLYLSYTGSLPQWQAFLQRRDLRPAAFEHDKLQYDAGSALHFESPRLRLDSTGLMMIGAQSSLDLEMNYMMDHGKATWDVAGVVLRPDRDKKTFIAAYRQPKPADDAAKERRERWEHMSRRDGEFAGNLQHDDQLTDFWIRTVAAGDGTSDATRPLYEVVYNTDRSLPAREMEDIRGKLATSFKITE
jgi:hypothetical protein